MAYEQPLFSLGQFALDFDASSVATYQYTFVQLGTAQNGAQGTGMGNAALEKVSGAGVLALGVIQSNGRLNEAVEVRVLGTSRIKISTSAAAGSKGDIIACAADGTAVKAAAGQFGLGQMLEDYQPGDTSTVLLLPYGKQ